MKKIINTSKAPAPIGPYNQAVLCGNTLYISGQIPMNVETGTLVEGNIKKETEQCMRHLKAILEEAGMTFENVVKTSIFLKDMHQFAAVNEVKGDEVFAKGMAEKSKEFKEKGSEVYL